MCHPKPGSRCFTDAAKPILGNVSKLNKAADSLEKAKADAAANPEKEVDVKFYEEMVQEAADQLDTSKVLMYSTSRAKTKKESVLLEGQAYTNELSDSARGAASSDYALYQAGRFASLYQMAADKYRNGGGGTQLEVSRQMINRTFPEINRQTLKKIENARDARLAAASESDDPTLETEEIEREYRRNVKAAELAYRVSYHDAAGVVGKDMDKNSARMRYPMDKREVNFRKSKTGDFHISTTFKVKASTQDGAEHLVDESFSLEDVNITSIKSVGNSEYDVTAKYVYRGGETLEDAEKFHSKAWLGSPTFRALLDSYRDVETANR